MTTETLEIITQQQELIEQYRLVVESYKNSKEKLYELLEALLNTLKMDNPAAKALVIEHLTKLVEERR
jgi:predicted nucleic-acid-binding protein